MCARRLSVFPFHNKMTRTSLTEFASLTAEQREAVFSCRHERTDAVGRDGETGKEKKRMKKEEEEKCSPRPRCVLTGCAGGSVLAAQSCVHLRTLTASYLHSPPPWRRKGEVRRRNETVVDVHVKQRLVTTPHSELSEGLSPATYEIERRDFAFYSTFILTMILFRHEGWTRFGFDGQHCSEMNK